ncbi:hypothetical protein BH10PLA2_BH10PLA2_03800 [soil metagenome]
MKLSDAVRDIIRLGDASRIYWDMELRKHHPRYPIVLPGEEPVPPPPESVEIRAILNSLSEEQLYVLLLLTYVGQGTYRADDLSISYQAVKEAFPYRALAIDQMMDNIGIAEDLEDASEELRKQHIQIDSLENMSIAGAS